MKFRWLLALLPLVPGCYVPPEPTPEPDVVPAGEITAAADRSMDLLRSHYADLSVQVADLIRDGKITSAKEEIDALHTAAEQAYLDAQRELEQLRDKLDAGEWDAARAERWHRESAEGYRQ